LLDDAGERVNTGLREGPVDDHVRLLARCAAAGLNRLPVVTGPLFAAAPDGTDPARLYRDGAVVVEPAFATVATWPCGGAVARYAIWSSTARRLDQLRPPPDRTGGGLAMFAAGTRFVVLGVDPDASGGPLVLLRELVPGHRADARDDRLTSRLRAAAESGRSQPGAAAAQPWALGCDATGRPFPLTAEPTIPAAPEGEGP
jgi:hypothetical protein